MNNVLHFSHIADPDGITPIMLSKLVGMNVTPVLVEAGEEIDLVFETYLEEGTLDFYDQIYVTDVCISSEIAEKIEQNPKLKQKIVILDHHHSRLEMNRYSFIKVVDTNKNGIRESATSLYYQYLRETTENPILEKASIRTFVELVRQQDTWDWQDDREMAESLSKLFSIYGREYFQIYFSQFLKNNNCFYLDEKQNYLLEIENIRIQNYFKEKKEEIKTVHLEGYTIGVVFADRYRSILGHYLATEYKDRYDFIILAGVGHGISYRGIKEIDLGTFSSHYGGGGHIKAAGSPLPKGFHNNVLKMIFPTIQIEEENDGN